MYFRVKWCKFPEFMSVMRREFASHRTSQTVLLFACIYYALFYSLIRL